MIQYGFKEECKCNYYRSYLTLFCNGRIEYKRCINSASIALRRERYDFEHWYGMILAVLQTLIWYNSWHSTHKSDLNPFAVEVIGIEGLLKVFWSLHLPRFLPWRFNSLLCSPKQSGYLTSMCLEALYCTKIFTKWTTPCLSLYMVV